MARCLSKALGTVRRGRMGRGTTRRTGDSPDTLSGAMCAMEMEGEGEERDE